MGLRRTGDVLAALSPTCPVRCLVNHHQPGCPVNLRERCADSLRVTTPDLGQPGSVGGVAENVAGADERPQVVHCTQHRPQQNFKRLKEHERL
jgi:hypothetical protein